MAELALASPVARQSRLLAGLKRGGARLWIGAALVAVLVLAALLAPAIAPHDPLEQDLMSAQLPPAWMVGGDPAYLLGTDSLGRCVLSRLIYSARTAAAAARVIGMSRAKLLRLEILPNLVPLLVTLLAVEMGIAILVEVILSFVGISVSGDTPTWGSMIAEGRQIVYQAPWIMALPIVCIITSVIGLNLLGDGLRLALDPVQRS